MPEENGLFARETDAPSAPEEAAAEIQTNKYLICISDGLLYGVDAEQVETIITDHTITRLPRVPHYVRGIINLRGQIIPIIDIRLRLGKCPKEGDSLCVVVNYNGTQVGILVDAVDQMINIANDIILPIPSQSAQKLVSGMCTLPDGSGTMLLLDCDQLMPHE